jgi:hypothetical protein
VVTVAEGGTMPLLQQFAAATVSASAAAAAASARFVRHNLECPVNLNLYLVGTPLSPM